MSELLNLTMGQLIEEAARKFPDRQAVKYTDRPYERTWREFDEECDRYAKGLMAFGVQKGDHLAIWAANIPEWLIALFAGAKIGAVIVTVNTDYKVFELEYLLRQSDTKFLVMMNEYKGTSYVDIINQLFPELKDNPPGELHNAKLPELRRIFYAGANTPAGMTNFKEIEKAGEGVSDEALAERKSSVTAQDVVNMQYTSGTTGFPKGVMLTNYNVVNNGNAIGDCMKFTEEDKLCIPVPFFHCFGLTLAITAAATHATAMVPIEYYRPTAVMQAIQDEECTAVHGVPTMFIAMLDHPDFDKYRFPRLRTGIMAGSPCPVKVMQQVADVMGAREMTIVFGQTESSPGCTQTTTDDSLEIRVSTVGRVLPGVEAKITDPETGKELGPHTQGEFCTRGYHVMKGYYKITGRIKDMIIRGGENIYPKEIEEFLYTNPKVRDVQVVGVPSKVYGEEILACVILKDGETATEEEIRESVRASMSRHKVPSYVAFVESFPMTASGKIQKYKLREWAIDKYNLHEDANIETA